MILKDSKGKDVEIYFYGDLDDIQVDEAFYADDESIVSEEEIEYILNKYEDEIYQDFCEKRMAEAEDFDDLYGG